MRKPKRGCFFASFVVIEIIALAVQVGLANPAAAQSQVSGQQASCPAGSTCLGQNDLNTDYLAHFNQELRQEWFSTPATRENLDSWMNRYVTRATNALFELRRSRAYFPSDEAARGYDACIDTLTTYYQTNTRAANVGANPPCSPTSFFGALDPATRARAEREIQNEYQAVKDSYRAAAVAPIYCQVHVLPYCRGVDTRGFMRVLGEVMPTAEANARAQGFYSLSDAATSRRAGRNSRNNDTRAQNASSRGQRRATPVSQNPQTGEQSRAQEQAPQAETAESANQQRAYQSRARMVGAGGGIGSGNAVSDPTADSNIAAATGSGSGICDRTGPANENGCVQNGTPRDPSALTSVENALADRVAFDASQLYLRRLRQSMVRAACAGDIPIEDIVAAEHDFQACGVQGAESLRILNSSHPERTTQIELMRNCLGLTGNSNESLDQLMRASGTADRAFRAAVQLNLLQQSLNDLEADIRNSALRCNGVHADSEFSLQSLGLSTRQLTDIEGPQPVAVTEDDVESGRERPSAIGRVHIRNARALRFYVSGQREGSTEGSIRFGCVFRRRLENVNRVASAETSALSQFVNPEAQRTCEQAPDEGWAMDNGYMAPGVSAIRNLHDAPVGTTGARGLCQSLSTMRGELTNSVNQIKSNFPMLNDNDLVSSTAQGFEAFASRFVRVAGGQTASSSSHHRDDFTVHRNEVRGQCFDPRCSTAYPENTTLGPILRTARNVIENSPAGLAVGAAYRALARRGESDSHSHRLLCADRNFARGQSLLANYSPANRNSILGDTVRAGLGDRGATARVLTPIAHTDEMGGNATGSFGLVPQDVLQDLVNQHPNYRNLVCRMHQDSEAIPVIASISRNLITTAVTTGMGGYLNSLQANGGGGALGLTPRVISAANTAVGTVMFLEPIVHTADQAAQMARVARGQDAELEGAEAVAVARGQADRAEVQARANNWQSRLMGVASALADLRLNMRGFEAFAGHGSQGRGMAEFLRDFYNQNGGVNVSEGLTGLENSVTRMRETAAQIRSEHFQNGQWTSPHWEALAHQYEAAATSQQQVVDGLRRSRANGNLRGEQVANAELGMIEALGQAEEHRRALTDNSGERGRIAYYMGNTFNGNATNRQRGRVIRIQDGIDQLEQAHTAASQELILVRRRLASNPDQATREALQARQNRLEQLIATLNNGLENVRRQNRGNRVSGSTAQAEAMGRAVHAASEALRRLRETNEVMLSGGDERGSAASQGVVMGDARNGIRPPANGGHRIATTAEIAAEPDFRVFLDRFDRELNLRNSPRRIHETLAEIESNWRRLGLEPNRINSERAALINRVKEACPGTR